MEGGAEHLRSLGQYHTATKRFGNKFCSQHAVTAHRGQDSASPQDGMEKGQSGRKLRRKAEQARDNTQHQRPILANTFFVLNTPSALLEQALPSPSSPTAGLVGGPLALFGPSCKETQKRRQMERAASIQLTPGIPAQKLSLAHKNRFCTLNEAKAGGYGMEKDISASIQSAKTQIRL